MYNTQYTLYKNKNSIYRVKVCPVKKISENNNFAGLNLVVAANRVEEVYAIILYLYKLNTKIRQEKQLSLYYKVYPTML